MSFVDIFASTVKDVGFDEKFLDGLHVELHLSAVDWIGEELAPFDGVVEGLQGG